MSTQIQLVLLCSLASIFGARRTQAQINEVSGTGTASWSPWELDFKGLLCSDLQTVPFAGLAKHWPKCFQDAVNQGATLSGKQNCRICDASFSGSKLEKDIGFGGTHCKAKVTCAAATRLSAADACFKGHGDVGNVKGLNDNSGNRKKHPKMACLPCPVDCKECHVEKQMDYSVTGRVKDKFKCILRPVGSSETGEHCEKPAGVSCPKDCKKRTCSGLLNMNCDKADYKTTCDFAKAFTHASETASGQGPEDYTIKMTGGAQKSQLPPVLAYLSEEGSANVGGFAAAAGSSIRAGESNDNPDWMNE